jgi:hypothetical protein
LEGNDLRRAGVRKAAACFVIADRSKGVHDDTAMDEDQLNVLRVWSIRKYAPKTPVFASNLR